MKINDLNSWVNYDEENSKNIETLIFKIRDYKVTVYIHRQYIYTKLQKQVTTLQ